MLFQVLKLVLWPKNLGRPQVVPFKPGVVNVISGASKTGKSAVIPIIDYCLGAEKCAIPVGVIRDCCAWFGIVVQTEQGQKLFARREPGDQQQTGDMYVLEGADIELPAVIERHNTNATAVKAELDRLAGLPQLAMEANQDRSFKSRPSFRDLAAFVFQPQNIVANPGVLFFKADTTEHREKLKAIFPYVLGAVNGQLLAARQRLDSLENDIRRRELALSRERKAANEWVREGQSWLTSARSFGLAAPGPLPDSAGELVEQLRLVLQREPSGVASNEQTDSLLGHLERLREEERAEARVAMGFRQRLAELQRLQQGGQAYGSGLQLQRDRLSVAIWLRERFRAGSPDARVVASDSEERLERLCDALQATDANAASFPLFSDAIQAQAIEQRAGLEQSSGRLRAVRAQLAELEKTSNIARNEAGRHRDVERFLGRLEEALRFYDRVGETSTRDGELEALRDEARRLREVVREHDIRERMKMALSRLQGFTSRIVPELDAEWKDSPIRLDPTELSVVVQRGNREDFLWEVGSGANWLAYHIAMTLALQKFFLGYPRHPVPGLLVYDQPSQVYFPKREDLIRAEDEKGSDDIKAVRAVFKVLGDAVLEAKGRLQILVLDHAYKDVWGGLGGVELAAEWRDERKLVPPEWVES